jgi:hypothetical protein
VEAVEDPPTGLVEHDGLPLDGPIARKGPLVEPQPPRTASTCGVSNTAPSGEAKCSVRAYPR